MLKFRFKKKEIRRRSNSCPNLDSINADAGRNQTQDFINKHSSCYIEKRSDHESDNDVPSPTKKERLHAQQSIRRVKKKEKEQQDNVEKNLLSADDFWRKLDTLKEWLHDEQGNKEVDCMQSPKLRSHFKKFIKLWNKRKLPLKYYKNCCVDVEAESSSAEIPTNRCGQSPAGQRLGQDAFTFDFLPHSTLKDLPSYHHFPFIDESSEKMMSPASSVFSTPPVSLKNAAVKGDDCNDNSSNNSLFTTFGKSMCDPHISTSLLARQIDLHVSQRKESKSKNKDGLTSPFASTSPKKFATISRSTPASSVFKSFSPQVHAVVSPTCPYPPLKNGFTTSREMKGSDSDRDSKNPSPAYMCVQDAIPFDSNSPSPKYWQVGFDDVFEEDALESLYCTLSPFRNSEKSFIHNKATDLSSKLSRNPSNLSRRRSKSMEDIYAVPSRLLAMDIQNRVTSPLQEDMKLTTPPVPIKLFTPSSSVTSLGSAWVGKQNPLMSPEPSESNYTLVSSSSSSSSSSSGFDNNSERLASSTFLSENSLSIDMGYQSGKFGMSEGSQRSVGSILSSSIKSSTSLKYQQGFYGVKRRSEEHETNIDEIESPKKNKPTPSQFTSPSLVEKLDSTAVERNSQPADDSTVDSSSAQFSKDSSNLKTDSSQREGLSRCPQQNPIKSILTGSLNPTTRTPKTKRNSGARSEKDRLSILQIKVLDKSPTFPRRKIKRRSSSLAVTPGKGLTFGTKNNPRLAVSSPRRVSFAKNVRNNEDENTTPLRNMLSSSSSKVSVKGRVPNRDISRQSHDKAEFEAFWALHDNPNNKSNSPVKESGVTSKQQSPSKWLSPSKITTLLGNGSSTQWHPHSDSCKAGTSCQDVGNKSVFKSLSPKKLFTSLQKNLSTSSLLTNSVTSCPTDLPVNHGNESKSTDAIAKPKSILKVKTTVSSPVKYNSPPNGDITTSCPSKRQAMGKINEVCSGEKTSRSNDLNLELCRSPPRLGVASLKAARFASTQNLSSLPRSKQRLLFEARIDKSTLPSSSSLGSFHEESHNLPPLCSSFRDMKDGNSDDTLNMQEYAEHNATSTKLDTDINDDTNSNSVCESLPPPPPFLLDETCEDIVTAHQPTGAIIINGSSLVSPFNNNTDNESGNSEHNGTNDHTSSSGLQCNTGNQLATSYNTTNGQSETCEHFDPLVNDDLKCIGTNGSDDTPLSKAVLERIKSFRSSPKVEENDGWITERRRSRGSRSKSFRNSPSQSTMQYPLHSHECRVSPSLDPNNDNIPSDSIDVPLSEKSHNDIVQTELANTNNHCDAYLGMNKETSHKTEQGKTLLSTEHLDIAVNHNDAPFSADVDKGYETESKSSKGQNCKYGGMDRFGNFEDESVSSMTSSDSGNCGKIDACDIYDVPRTCIHVAKNMPSFVGLENSSLLSADSLSHSSSQLTKACTCKDSDNPIHYNQPDISGEQDLKTPSQIPLVTTSASTTQSRHMCNESNKENTCTVKLPRPKPLVRPKPKPLPKPSNSYQQSNSLSPSSTRSVQPCAKRRNSLVKRQSVTIKNPLRPPASSSFNTDNYNQIGKPLVRKRSSVASREESVKGKPFRNVASTNTSFKTTPQKSDSKRESITPYRRKKTSLEKNGRRSSMGLSLGPEQTSFAQRKKFFQQLQTSSNGSSATSKVSSIKVSHSFLDKSRPKATVKPITRLKSEAT